MAMLQHALAWAGRGYRVFPLSPNSRRPAWEGWDWTREATTDTATIRAWWDAGEWNIGCLTGGGLVVVDLDVKRADRNGITSYLALGGDLNTLTVRTTTGGRHLYFRGDGRNTAGKLGPGIDTRGEHGYVVAPGSTIDGRAYEVARDRPVAPLPAVVAETLARAAAVATNTPLVELDTPVLLAGAAAWLQEAAPAIQGRGGDAHTYHIACELRDRGISAVAALSLLLEHWNERCSPPWEAEELKQKVENAYQYAQNPAGAKAAEVLLGSPGGIVIPDDIPAAAPAQDAKSLSAWRLGAATPLADLRPRPWLYRRFLMRGEITLLAAAGAVGKSQMALTTAIHLALGRDLFGFKPAHPGEPLNSVIYNAEDRLDEMSRRLYAACSALGVPPTAVLPHIALVSGKDPASGRPRLARMGGSGPELVVDDVNMLLNVCHHQRVAMLGIDPLVKLHSGLNESDNTHMDVVMEAIAEIADKGNMAVLLAHHLAKMGIAATDGYAGSVDAIRGAGNIVNSARFAFTMAGPTREDVDRLGLTREQRERLVRLDDAKMNMALRSSEPVWIEKRTVLLPTGDEVGAFVPADMRAATAMNRRQMADRLFHEMQGRGAASLPLGEVVAILRDADPIYSKLTAAVARARLEAFFVEDADLTGGGLLRLTPGEKRMLIQVGT